MDNGKRSFKLTGSGPGMQVTEIPYPVTESSSTDSGGKKEPTIIN
jgi:hypothetical protein